MQVYYDKDADLSIIQKMKVVIVGYGLRAMPMPITSAIPALRIS